MADRLPLHTAAGHEVFWTVFENHPDAMVNPDYTDEEIRREVRNWGVDEGQDGKLQLEEKGTVYNEMVSSYEHPQWDVARGRSDRLWATIARAVGGHPAAIRKMKAEDIRKFHATSINSATWVWSPPLRKRCRLGVC